MYKSLRVLLVIAVIQGCSTSYYGHTKEEWDKLSVEDQDAIKQEYQVAIDSMMEQKHKDVIDARTRSIIERGLEGRKQ